MPAASCLQTAVHRCLCGATTKLWTTFSDFSLGSFCQRQRGWTLDVSAKTVGDDLDDGDLGRGDADDAAIVLADEVAGQHAMHEAVFALHEAVVAALQRQRADHLHGVERELLEELARTLYVRPHAGGHVA